MPRLGADIGMPTATLCGERGGGKAFAAARPQGALSLPLANRLGGLREGRVCRPEQFQEVLIAWRLSFPQAQVIADGFLKGLHADRGA